MRPSPAFSTRSSKSGTSSGVLQNSDDNRAKVEAGLMVTAPNGWGVRAAGNYDGIGGDDFDSYGGSLWLNIPLH